MALLHQFSLPARVNAIQLGHPHITRCSPRLRFQFLSKEEFTSTEKTLFKAANFRNPLVGIHAAAAATVEAPDVSLGTNGNSSVDLLACPICYDPLIRKGPSVLSLSAISRSGFQCQKCRKTYSSRDVYLDLTVTAGSSQYDEYRPATTEIFRSPLVSFIYERGWRQNFASSGFPGPDEEAVQQVTGTSSYLTERELKDLCKTCGLVDYSCIRRRAFIMIYARKPQ